MTDALGSKIQLVGDDLFVTNTERLTQGIDKGVANSILIKVNQIGTLTETLDAMRMAEQGRLHVRHVAPVGRNRRRVHRRPGGGDGCGPDQDRFGEPHRSHRKYNQLLRIEEELGAGAQYAGRKAFRQESCMAVSKLVLVRHGESNWNLENRFTGWTDVDLSDKGREEAEGGRLLKEGATPSTWRTRPC